MHSWFNTSWCIGYNYSVYYCVYRWAVNYQPSMDGAIQQTQKLKTHQLWPNVYVTSLDPSFRLHRPGIDLDYVYLGRTPQLQLESRKEWFRVYTVKGFDCQDLYHRNNKEGSARQPGDSFISLLRSRERERASELGRKGERGREQPGMVYSNSHVIVCGNEYVHSSDNTGPSKRPIMYTRKDDRYTQTHIHAPVTAHTKGFYMFSRKMLNLGYSILAAGSHTRHKWQQCQPSRPARFKYFGALEVADPPTCRLPLYCINEAKLIKNSCLNCNWMLFTMHIMYNTFELHTVVQWSR